MKICGLKLTHDGAIAVIDGNTLVFSVEMEKIKNNPRYTDISNTAIIKSILRDHGYSVPEIDHFVIDGWGGTNQDELAIQPRLEIGQNHNYLAADNDGVPYSLAIAPYTEKTSKHSIQEEWNFEGLKIGKHQVPYSSFLHVNGHVMSAYMTSQFARQQESSYVLIWDGGMYPRLYFFDAQEMKVHNLGPLFLLIGNIYTIFSQHFGPFKVKGGFAKDDLSIAGKVMAYIALGQEKPELYDLFDDIISASYDKPMGFANIFANVFKKRCTQTYKDEDILCTFHLYLEQMLVNALKKKISRFDFRNRNLCMAGGCALNIKWNSAVREAGFFDAVYVPPFPNDSGSAIGAACSKLVSITGNTSLNWSVYRGPAIVASSATKGWRQRHCSLKELANLLHETNEPVVFLNGNAELGPRALGNRSMIAAPVSHGMKDTLNLVKNREKYRPVSPICLEEAAPDIFEPGIKDPFMLFDHMVKQEWVARIPAVLHIDGSARLQTVNKSDNPVVYELLVHYFGITGIPLLCNTSANLNGSGFFPDVYSASQWNKVNYIWSDNRLFEKVEKINFPKATQKDKTINQPL
ncbi:MAG: carbamoyltransferase N-terminal domain-containing protein [Ginsengibacter sp.]